MSAKDLDTGCVESGDWRPMVTTEVLGVDPSRLLEIINFDRCEGLPKEEEG